MNARVFLLVLIGALSPGFVSAAASSPTEVVLQDLEALSRGHLEEFLALYDPAAQIHGIPEDPHLLVGKLWEHMLGAQKLRQYFEKQMAKPEQPRIVSVERIELGELVASRMKITDPPRHDNPVYLLVIYRVRDGLIQDIWHVARETPQTARHSEGALKTTQQLLETNNRGDVEGFLALFGPEAKQFRKGDDPHQLANRPSTKVVDQASRRKAYQQMFAQGPPAQIEMVKMFAVGDLAIAHERARVASDPDHFSDNLTILRVRDGLIQDIWDVEQVKRPATASRTPEEVIRLYTKYAVAHDLDAFISLHDRVTGLPDNQVADELTLYQVRDGLVRTIWYIDQKKT